MIAVYDDTRGPGTCRSCGAHIQWYETVLGKRMPMEDNAAPVSHQDDFISGRVVLRFDNAASHWANCPDAKQWKGKRR